LVRKTFEELVAALEKAGFELVRFKEHIEPKYKKGTSGDCEYVSDGLIDLTVLCREGVQG
jgi:hypothetical protein